MSFYLAFAGAAAHGVYTALSSFVDLRLNLSLSSMVVVVSFITVVIFLLAATRMQIRKLGILVYPMTLASLLFSLFWPIVTSRVGFLVIFTKALGKN